jgi:hypothetical protein
LILTSIWYLAPTGGIRQNLFEIHYCEKLHAPPAWRARARTSREGRRDKSTVNNSRSKLKIRLTWDLENLLLFPSMGRGTCESKYRRRKNVNNKNSNCPKVPDLLGYPRGKDIGSTSLQEYPDNLKTITKALVQLVLKTLEQFIRLS